MPELERLLTGLGRELDYPPTPDLAGAVARRLAPEPPRKPFSFRGHVSGAPSPWL